MRKNNIYLKKIILIFLCGILFFDFTISTSDASVIDDKRTQLKKIDQEIKFYRRQSEERASQIKSLKIQLEILDVELKEAELRLQKIEGEIQLSDMEIAQITGEIKKVEEEKNKNQDTLKKAIRVKYSQGDMGFTEIIASSDSLSDILSKESYMQAIQQKINNAVKKIKELELELDNKRKKLENKKAVQENLRQEQLVMKNQLNSQMMAKNDLLQKTKGEQASYNNLFQQSLKEKSQVNYQIARLTSGPRKFYPSGSSVSGYVNIGDVIGYQGNTGFSTGSHLHFGLYKGGVDIDPMPYLSNGYLIWPVNGKITQNYLGVFSHRGVGWPGGIDLVDYPGAPVKAARSGRIIFNGGNTSSGFGHYIIIDHEDGFSTLYAHLQ